MKKITAFFILMSFIVSCVMPPQGLAQALTAVGMMPEPGSMVSLTTSFTPAYLWGMSIHSNDPFKFDFLVQRGDVNFTDAQQKQGEYSKLIKYFLAALAVPDIDQWVNLSPYEENRIIPDDFGLTEMGRDLLAQDYLLKQLSASLTDPRSDLGKKFWDGVYAQAYQKFGSTDVPTDTISKVWILPDKAKIFEKDNTVYVLESHLKVMTEKDYLAMKSSGASEGSSEATAIADISSQVIKEVVIPAIEKEVNEGQLFAPLRQVYSGMLLATWYKRALKQSILGRVYADQGKVKGVDQDPKVNQEIYGQYVQAFKKGVFNMIKEDVDRYTQEVIPRKYFSGGTIGVGLAIKDFAQGTPEEQRAVAAKDMSGTDVVATFFRTSDFAQNSKVRETVKRWLMIVGVPLVILAGAAIGVEHYTGIDFIGMDIPPSFESKWWGPSTRLSFEGKDWPEKPEDMGTQEILALLRRDNRSGDLDTWSLEKLLNRSYPSHYKLVAMRKKNGEVVVSFVLDPQILSKSGVVGTGVIFEGKDWPEKPEDMGTQEILSLLERDNTSGDMDIVSLKRFLKKYPEYELVAMRRKNGEVTVRFVLNPQILSKSGVVGTGVIFEGKDWPEKPEDMGTQEILSLLERDNTSGDMDIVSLKKFLKNHSEYQLVAKRSANGEVTVGFGRPDFAQDADIINGLVDDSMTKGGIDLAQSNLDMQIKRDGAGVLLPISQQNLDNIHIDGLVPVILNIYPAVSVPQFSNAGASMTAPA